MTSDIDSGADNRGVRNRGDQTLQPGVDSGWPLCRHTNVVTIASGEQQRFEAGQQSHEQRCAFAIKVFRRPTKSFEI